MINGWVLDPDRKKMAKSKGNVVTPQPLLEQYGSDGVRYWACSGRPGTDTAVDAGQMKNGRRLAVKLLNASKFALAFPAATDGADHRAARPGAARPARRRGRGGHDGLRGLRLRPRAGAHRGVLLGLLRRLHRAGQGPGVRRGRGRRLGPPHAAAGLDVLLRLFAPVLPFATEEVWSWWRRGLGAPAALADRRRDPPPASRATPACCRSPRRCSPRSARPRARPSCRCAPRWPGCWWSTRPRRWPGSRRAVDDLRNAGVVADLVLEEGDAPRVEVELAPVAATP